ncbi:hypothetical protein KO481_25060 [Nocardia sp. NEAU-G5]|uniref:Secreted protein n=1 Tax=Nocardia albiluteola TaxID=2842303 RepID=A0ABS6B4U9_9NOCA|nr:hypothetical protein [Nocardia albiluteola]MBU3064785.1 hypothetical protein [Nocardia albiluteola]
MASTTQVLAWVGSRAWAWSDAVACSGVRASDPVSHLPTACGPGLEARSPLRARAQYRGQHAGMAAFETVTTRRILTGA